MKAVILAAGYATRLKPYTRLYPKTLLRVGGRPLLEGTVSAIAAAPAVDGMVLVTNSRFLPFFERWRATSPAARLRPVTVLDDGTASNETRRGSVGDLLFAMDRLDLDDDLLVVCSDKLFEFSIPAFLGFAAEKGGGANTCEDVGDPAKLANKHGCAVLAADGRIVDFQEKPARPGSSIESIAFYIFPKTALPLIREFARTTSRPDAPGTLLEWLCPRSPMYGWMIDGECLDVGDAASYRRADSLAWKKQGKKSRAIEVLLDGRGVDDARIEALLDRLEMEPAVTMVHLADDAAERCEALVTRRPHLLPVDVMPTSAPAQALALARDCRWIVEPGGRPADIDRIAPLPVTPGVPHVARRG
jgi:glucose-1-phosphate thymidylyltransferase